MKYEIRNPETNEYESITEEELRAIHAEELEMDAEMPNWMAEEMKELLVGWAWPANPDFDVWLEDRINEWRVRKVE